MGTFIKKHIAIATPVPSKETTDTAVHVETAILQLTNWISKSPEIQESLFDQLLHSLPPGTKMPFGVLRHLTEQLQLRFKDFKELHSRGQELWLKTIAQLLIAYPQEVKPWIKQCNAFRLAYAELSNHPIDSRHVWAAITQILFIGTEESALENKFEATFSSVRNDNHLLSGYASSFWRDFMGELHDTATDIKNQNWSEAGLPSEEWLATMEARPDCTREAVDILLFLIQSSGHPLFLPAITMLSELLAEKNREEISETLSQRIFAAFTESPRLQMFIREGISLLTIIGASGPVPDENAFLFKHLCQMLNRLTKAGIVPEETISTDLLTLLLNRTFHPNGTIVLSAAQLLESLSDLDTPGFLTPEFKTLFAKRLVQSVTDSTQELRNALKTAAGYLLDRHPEFFNEFPELLPGLMGHMQSAGFFSGAVTIAAQIAASGKLLNNVPANLFNTLQHRLISHIFSPSTSAEICSDCLRFLAKSIDCKKIKIEDRETINNLIALLKSSHNMAVKIELILMFRSLYKQTPDLLPELLIDAGLIPALIQALPHPQLKETVLGFLTVIIRSQQKTKTSYTIPTAILDEVKDAVLSQVCETIKIPPEENVLDDEADLLALAYTIISGIEKTTRPEQLLDSPDFRIRNMIAKMMTVGLLESDADGITAFEEKENQRAMLLRLLRDTEFSVVRNAVETAKLLAAQVTCDRHPNCTEFFSTLNSWLPQEITQPSGPENRTKWTAYVAYALFTKAYVLKFPPPVLKEIIDSGALVPLADHDRVFDGPMAMVIGLAQLHLSLFPQNL